MVIEDAHWADRPTLDLLTYLMLARNDVGVTVVVTYRSAESETAPSAAEWLDLVRMTPSVVEVALAPLSRTAFEDLLAELAPGIDHTVADRLYARSEGNPFFTEQLLASSEAPSTARLPSRLAGLLGRRLDRLSDAERLVMEVLAIAARPLTVDALARVIGFAEAETVRSVHRLVDASLVTVSGRDVRPRHALVREAVLDSSPVLQGQMHGRLGSELEAMDPRDLAPEAAGHYRAAGRTHDELRTARIAATRAWEPASYSEAANWGLRAFALLAELDDEPRPGTGLGILAWRTYRSLGSSGNAPEEDRFGRTIWDMFKEWPDSEERGLVLTQVSAMETTRNWWSLPLSAQRLLEDPDLPDSATHASFLYNVAVAVARQGDLERGQQLLASSLEMALRVEAWEEAITATGWQSILRRGRADAEPVEAALHRMDQLATHVKTARGALNHAILASDMLLKDGQLAEARIRARSGWDVAREHGLASSFNAGLTVANAAQACCELGLVSEAEELVTAFKMSSFRPGDMVAASIVESLDARIGLLRGRAGRSEAHPRLGDDFHREASELSSEQLLWRGDSAGAHAEAVLALNRLLRPRDRFRPPDGSRAVDPGRPRGGRHARSRQARRNRGHADTLHRDRRRSPPRDPRARPDPRRRGAMGGRTGARTWRRHHLPVASRGRRLGRAGLPAQVRLRLVAGSPAGTA